MTARNKCSWVSLLAALVLIVLAFATVLPFFQRLWQVAAETSCYSHMAQLGLAFWPGRKPAGISDSLKMANSTILLMCLAGDGQLEHGGANYAVGKRDVLLLPAVVGACVFRPRSAVSLLELSLPEGT